MPRYDGKNVWITGGGSGIGRALALEYARLGARVAVSGRRADRLRQTVAAIEAAGGRALALPCDVTDERAVSEVVVRIVAATGRLDVAVANAGYAVTGRFEDLAPDVWRRQLDVNVLGLVATARAALPELRRSRGRLVLVGSLAAFVATPRSSAYAASKAAVRAIGEALSLELDGSGVSCTTVHPGYVATDIVRIDNEGRFRPERRDPRPPALTARPETVAREIVAAAHARRRSAVLSAYGKLLAGATGIAPDLLPALMTVGRRGRRSRREAGEKIPRAPDAVVPPRVVPLDRPPLRIDLRSPPSTASIYLRALRLGARRPQGLLTSARAARLAPIDVRLPGVHLDPGLLARFRDVCACPPRGLAVPATYPECLFLGPMAEAVLSRGFPFSPLGLIHVRQEIEQLAPLEPGATVDLGCRMAEIRETGRGFEIDFLFEVSAGREVAWRGRAMLLSRNAATRARGGRSRRTAPPPDAAGFAVARVRVPEDTGRRYAAASGDWSPHHLHAATARALGYRRAIAHGMWTLARAVAEVEAGGPLPLPLRVRASFQRPLFLPGEMEIRRREASSGAITIEVREPDTGAPHMLGEIDA